MTMSSKFEVEEIKSDLLSEKLKSWLSFVIVLPDLGCMFLRFNDVFFRPKSDSGDISKMDVWLLLFLSDTNGVSILRFIVLPLDYSDDVLNGDLYRF